MSTHYQPPLQDSLFLLSKVLDWQKLFACPRFSHVDEELATAVLTEGAKFAQEVLAPLNASGDSEGSQLLAGQVQTPAGFKKAYESFVEGGWPGLDMPEEYGGQALPLSIQVAFAEMLNGACIAFSMLPIMLRAAASLLIEHAGQALVDKVVPKLVAGEWGATICISEAQAGSDVGRIKTLAREQADGSYQLNGTKIFISYGDQDLTAQIVHLVLARTVDAPAGTRGLSLFLVPKLDFDSGEKNRVTVSRLEKKMGLKASPTCVLDFDGARAYRIGEAHRGLQCMFTMVNLMRLEVSIQGPAIAAAACRRALDYALERTQGGAADAPALPIIEHADVRRMLFIMRARSEAMRALVFEAAFNLDMARAATDAAQAQESAQLAEFLLPVCKAAGSQCGFEVANLALQVFGGHGYIADNGVEQYVRDARVSMIYEGSNGIQALDLVTRKLLRDEGLRLGIFRARLKADLHSTAQHAGCRNVHAALVEGLDILQQASDCLLSRQDRQRDVEAAAADYLSLLALVAGGWMWLRICAKLDAEGEYARTKQALANYYARQLMPECSLFLTRIEQGADCLDAISASELAGPA